jgi:hypothetical protein
MSYEIKGRLSLKITFNGEEFLFDRVNSLDFLHMTASTRIGVPMLHMALQDNIGFLSESKHLADGARIQIVVSAIEDNKAKTYTFRLNSFKREPNQGAYRYEMDGYVDASTYWHASTVDAFNGTSYAALRNIASLCGLNFNGDETTDSQVWTPRNIRYHEWARLISERGFRSDGSCMQLGMNIDRSLVYRDLSEDKAPVLKFNFGGYKTGYLLISDAVPTTSSGSMNHHSGYAGSVVEQDTQTSAVHKLTDKIQVALKSGEGSLQLNSKIKDAVKRADVKFAPIDVGNVHVEYERALYQNRRVNNLFTSRIDVVTPDATALGLLDTVAINMDQSTEFLKAYSGDYRVASRVVRVEGNQYFEKLELLRRTINERSPTAVS